MTELRALVDADYAYELGTKDILLPQGGYPVAEVARRLGTTSHSLYSWLKRYGNGAKQAEEHDLQQAEIRRLRAELKRVTEERDILRQVTAYFAKESH